MHYSFDIELATKYGDREAILLQNFIYWIAKNAANGKHYHDGRYWTYNSVAALVALFPFWTTRQVRTILASLIKQGCLVEGNYNEKGYDRTKWYALGDEIDKWICQNWQMGSSNGEIPFVKIDKPIPDIKPNNKQDIYAGSRARARETSTPINKTFSYRDALVAEGVSAENEDRLMANRRAKRLTNNEASFNKLMGAVKEICRNYGVTADEVVEFAGEHGWGFIDPGWREVEGIRARKARSGRLMTLDELIKRDTSYYDKQGDINK